MKRILIVYGTAHGHTLKIANKIAELIRVSGWSADVVCADTIRSITFEDYAGVVAGASVQASGYPKYFRKFIKANAEALSMMPGAFFSVCLGILQTSNEKVQKEERKIVTDFFNETSWHPDSWTVFAGALPYSKYGWFTRQVMWLISKRAGENTDTSRDYEYTDWNSVADFTSDFLKAVNNVYLRSPSRHDLSSGNILTMKSEIPLKDV